MRILFVLGSLLASVISCSFDAAFSIIPDAPPAATATHTATATPSATATATPTRTPTATLPPTVTATATATATLPPVVGQGSVPPRILAALREGGVNLVFGFYDSQNYNPRMFDADLPVIAAAGAGHVRIPISNDVIEDGTSGRLRNDRFVDIRDFVERARSHNLVTIIDYHTTNQRIPGSSTWNEDYMGGLRDPNIRRRHISLMVDLVTRMAASGVPRDWFVVQPANEPIFSNGDQAVWYNHQQVLIPAMRAACADCVFFIMGHDWQGVDSVWQLRNDVQLFRNNAPLIGDFHTYDPIGLTHCAYPGQPNRCVGLQWPGQNESWRGREYWDRARMAQVLQPVVDFARDTGIPVHFSEIGTTALLAENVRAAYLGDVVSIMEANDWGWTLYEWSNPNFRINNHPSVVNLLRQF